MTEGGTYDYGEFKDPPPQEGSNSMAMLAGLAKEQLDAEALVASCEERLTEARTALISISLVRLPTVRTATWWTWSSATPRRTR